MNLSVDLPGGWVLIVSAHRWRDKDGHRLIVQKWHGEKSGWLWSPWRFVRQAGGGEGKRG